MLYRILLLAALTATLLLAGCPNSDEGDGAVTDPPAGTESTEGETAAGE